MVHILKAAHETFPLDFQFPAWIKWEWNENEVWWKLNGGLTGRDRQNTITTLLLLKVFLISYVTAYHYLIILFGFYSKLFEKLELNDNAKFLRDRDHKAKCQFDHMCLWIFLVCHISIIFLSKLTELLNLHVWKNKFVCFHKIFTILVWKVLSRNLFYFYTLLLCVLVFSYNTEVSPINNLKFFVLKYVPLR